MAIRVALNHISHYRYDRPVNMSPHVVRLRPAPHARTPIHAYSFRVTPDKNFLNWQQDPYSNYLARLVFPEKASELKVEVDLVAEMTVINPFDFFVEASAEKYPFTYEPVVRKELLPYLETTELTPLLAKLLATVQRKDIRTTDYLVELNMAVHNALKYLIRLEPGVQNPEETLTKGCGSCRDFAWLLVHLMRHLGLAARFVSGYLIQLTADVKSLDGPSGPEKDFTDLHAWAEVYLPGAGWIGLDATSGLFTGEGHIPLACTAEPISAAPITGATDKCESIFSHIMTVRRVYEDPRVTKPYTPEQWREIEALGHLVDQRLVNGDVRLTMGGEPTFVSIDDMEGAQWNTAALGEEKRRLAGDLMHRLRKRFATIDKSGAGGFLHFGQGKWYPGESLPRWALGCYWRPDGVPLWNDPGLLADEKPIGHDENTARTFINTLARRLGDGVNPSHIVPAFEDTWYYLWKERRLPTNVDPFNSKLENKEDRLRLAKIFEQGLDKTIGFALPLKPAGDPGSGRWQSGQWFVRTERMYLLPGDSPMGLRLPLDSLQWVPPGEFPTIYDRDPMENRDPLPDPKARQMRLTRHRPLEKRELAADAMEIARRTASMDAGPADAASTSTPAHPASEWTTHGPVIRTALCAESRGGVLRIFMPPARYIEDYLDLVAHLEETAEELHTPIIIEGYTPPHDTRVSVIKVTPDPGVIEVNTHPVKSWDQAVAVTQGLYEDAHFSRLGTEKFMVDGRHSGTGGGNHIVVGGPTPADSPFLRRPDLLKSLLSYWHNHPSLSYLFSGLFIGPTSQAPRADEGRGNNLYELEIAMRQIPDPFILGTGQKWQPAPAPWLVDRVFRHLLVDLTGNTHRAEFCIDKLYSPDTATGRLGLVEFRGFEMPPHPQMSLTQQLLLRALIANFWHNPYTAPLIRWAGRGTELHDRFMLPHFVREDFQDVLREIRSSGFPLKADWFDPHLEFRFPAIGAIDVMHSGGVHLELRQAIEPWYVLGEEPAGGATARFVDSSVERLQIKVQGLINPRHQISVNGIAIPLHPTGRNGEYVAGVRYRAWQPPSCLHPTIAVHTPLVFDIVDAFNHQAIGGCTYHVTHPGGRSFDDFPVNAFAAESRRISRFFKFGHTPGVFHVRHVERSLESPFTLDLRRT